MDYTWYDFAGNLGVFLLLVAFFLLQLNKITSDQISYSLTNVVGATLILISLAIEFNLSAFAIEFFWLLISIVGVINYFRRKKRNSSVND